MTDTVQSAQPTSTAVSATGPGQSPLDVLDQILKDAQNKATSEIAEKALKEAALVEAERERQRQVDAARVQKEVEKIATLKETPQYQAMVDQKQEAEQQQQEYKQQMTGMEIVQLSHTKL